MSSNGVVRVRAGAIEASVAALDEAGVSRARELIERTGSDPAAEEIRRRAGVFLRRAAQGAPKIAFLFSGQGSQYAGMMRALAADDAAARAITDRAPREISEMMFSGAPIPTELFAVQSTVLLAGVMAHAALEAAGIEPSFVTGHSFGDYAALVAARAWTLETALEATRIRCEAIAASSASGGMTSVSASLEVVRALIEGTRAELANINAPDQVVIAGEYEALDAAEKRAAAQKIETARLPIPRAFHSSRMRDAKPLLAARFANLLIEEPKRPYLSSVTGRLERDPEAIRRALVEQLTLPVNFVAQVSWLLEQGVNTFVECGPRGVLAGLARRIAPQEALVVTSDDANKPGRWAIARVLAALDSITAEHRPDLSITLPSAVEPGFTEFWAETRPQVERFVQSLFQREQGTKPRTLRPATMETMQRHIIRAIVADPLPSRERFAPRTLRIVGRSPRAQAIAKAFEARGTIVTFDAKDDVEALGIVLDPAPTPPLWSLAEAQYHALREETIALPFRTARAFKGKTIFAVTALGGALGFENAIQGRAEGGALLGLLKAIRRELPQLRVQALDASPSEDPQAIAAALLAELDAGSPRLEVGLLRGKRMVLAIAERALMNAGDARMPTRWLITGGARGVTARIAIQLAELNKPVLHLAGKHALPPETELAKLRALDAQQLEAVKLALPKPSPLAWKAACEAIDKTLEIDRNLRELRARGSEVHYHAVDVADRAALAGVIEKARPIVGLIHGSGVEIAKAFDKKTDAIFDATVAAKLDGLINLLHTTAPQVVVGFSSVSGRFGGHGQTDYSLANEAMARVLSLYRAQHPERRAFAVSWPAFSEVGLAARGSAKAFLEQAGQSFMTPKEGAQHLVRELEHGAPEAEIIISDHPEHLDQDDACKARLDERLLDAKESFLDQHRMADVPILPAVVALQMLVERAGAEHTVADFEIKTPLKVPNGGARIIRVADENDLLSISANVTRNDGVVLEPWRVHMTAKRARPHAPKIDFELGAPTGVALDYPYGANLIFHGPMFRVVKSVTPHEKGGVAILIAPEKSSTLLPIELLDGCLQSAGMLGRLLHNITALPAGIGHFHRPDRRPGQEIRAEIRAEIFFTSAGTNTLESTIVARDAQGVLFVLERYRATA